MESTREGDTTGAPMAECVAVFVMFDPEAAKAVPLPDAVCCVCVFLYKKTKLYTHSRVFVPMQVHFRVLCIVLLMECVAMFVMYSDAAKAVPLPDAVQVFFTRAFFLFAVCVVPVYDMCR